MNNRKESVFENCRVIHNHLQIPSKLLYLQEVTRLYLWLYLETLVIKVKFFKENYLICDIMSVVMIIMFNY